VVIKPYIGGMSLIVTRNYIKKDDQLLGIRFLQLRQSDRAHSDCSICKYIIKDYIMLKISVCAMLANLIHHFQCYPTFKNEYVRE
jgi:hypothetical protein